MRPIGQAVVEFKMIEEQKKTVEKLFGKKALAYAEQENGENENQIKTQWKMLNVLTYYISHYINYKSRAQYQARLSNMFDM